MAGDVVVEVGQGIAGSTVDAVDVKGITLDMSRKFNDAAIYLCSYVCSYRSAVYLLVHWYTSWIPERL